MPGLSKILSLAISAIAAVQSAETALPNAPGDSKLTRALGDTVAAAGVILPALAAPARAAEVTLAFTTLLNGMVALANLIGAFRHRSTPAPARSAPENI